MDKNRTYFYLGGMAAIIFYLLLLFLLLLFFNDYRHVKRYVPKKSPSIEIALISKIPERTPPPKVLVKKPQEPSRAKVTPVVKKRSDTTKPRPKAIASLFKGIHVMSPVEEDTMSRLANAPKIRYRHKVSERKEPSKKSAEALIKDINFSKSEIKMSARSSGEGDVDLYMSKLYTVLYGSWQPMAIYAGSMAKVRLTIHPDGSFAYRILFPSDNQGFNESLIEYLDSLQKRGLPAHKRGKSLVIDVEFKAKE